MVTMIEYPVDLSQDEDGRWLAVFPDIPFTATDGATRAEALTEAADALGAGLAQVILDNSPPPLTSPADGRALVAPSARIAAKFALYRAMHAQGISKTELARRLGRAETEARRILDPKHNTGMPLLEAAFDAVGLRLILAVSDQAA